MIEQLKQIRDFVEVIQSINPSVCQLPPRVLLDASDAHAIISDLIEQLENSKPIGRIIEDRTHHLVEIHGYCKAMYGLPIKGRTNLYTHPAPQGETDAKSTEPVAWMVMWEQSERKPVFANCIEKAQWIAQPEGLADKPTSTVIPLYTHPAPLQELSNELINKLAKSYTVGDQFEANLAFDRIGFARAIEAHLKGNA